MYFRTTKFWPDWNVTTSIYIRLNILQFKFSLHFDQIWQLYMSTPKHWNLYQARTNQETW